MSNKHAIPYEESDLYKIRHSVAHIMAQAVLEQYPEARLAIGPPTADGFYYDFDLAKDQNGQPETFKPEDLKELEKRMRQIIGEQHPFIYREVAMEEARDLFQDQTFKLELIAGLAEGKIDEYRNIRNHPAIISTYQQDFFEDLCGGPHLAHTGLVPADG